jgi:hypothetical protein
MPRYDTRQTTLTIPSGSTISNRLELKWYEFTGITVPSITSGAVTVKVSNDDVLYVPVYDAYNIPVLSFAASVGNFGISSEALRHVLGYQFLKIVTSVSQVSTVTFEIRLKDNLG